MNIIEACKKGMDGGGYVISIRRKIWDEDVMIYFMYYYDSINDKTPSFYYRTDAEVAKHYIPKVEDIFAEDWEVCE